MIAVALMSFSSRFFNGEPIQSSRFFCSFNHLVCIVLCEWAWCYSCLLCFSDFCRSEERYTHQLCENAYSWKIPRLANLFPQPLIT